MVPLDQQGGIERKSREGREPAEDPRSEEQPDMLGNAGPGQEIAGEKARVGSRYLDRILRRLG